MATLHEDIQLYGLRELMTEEQEDYINAILNNKIVFVNARAGSGKTTVAVALAKYLNESQGMNLTYVFSPVQERSLGHRPGTQEEKEREYLAPLVDALLKINEFPANAIISEEIPKDKQWVTAKSHTFLRGTNIERQFLIIDEAQNMTRGELKKILTRAHDNCKIVVIGHDLQSDLPDPSKSGFVPYINHFKDEPYCEVVELTKSFRGVVSTKADELPWD